MIVQGGNSYLGRQDSRDQSWKADKGPGNFQDLLVGAKRDKDATRKSERKPRDNKKEEREAYDANQQAAKPAERPVRKKSEQAQEPRQVGRSQNTEKREPQSAERVQSQNVDANGKKITQGNEQGTQPVDSLNLSGGEKNSLGKNQKVLENPAESFENMMAEMKMQAAAKKSQEGLANGMSSNLSGGMQTKIGAQSSSKEGGLKLGAEFDLTQGGESLSINGAQSTDGLKALSQEGGEATSDQSTTNLESMFNQYLEQDPQVAGDDSVTFADSVKQAESGKGEKIENMQSIIKQARAFVDDGGGTMEIHLQPEGLGKVHLKVAVQDGQVNVEMLADNMNAKRALEEGLLDIRNALEGQKLAVETLKVEMTPDYQKDFTDLANHMQEQANRDFAEQFLGQFRQEREEKFGGMFDAFRNFQPGPSEPELTLNRNPYTENGKGRSVNLVA